jgi:hypothetical protein
VYLQAAPASAVTFMAYEFFVSYLLPAAGPAKAEKLVAP